MTIDLMAESWHRCSHCGAELSSGQLDGFCPACLLVAHMEDESGVGTVQTVLDPAVTGQPNESPTAKHLYPKRFGEFEICGEIGRGGMGLVYKARHTSLHRLVALKMILAGPVSSPEFSQRFRTEARAAAALDHPHIVPIYEVGEIDGQQFYAMRLVEGGNLAEYLQREGPPDSQQAATWLKSLAEAVHYAHQHGVLHRDLKPANILLDADLQPYIADFGLAKLMDEDSSLTLSQVTLGTPNYMSPEQAAGKLRQLTSASDIYSLGAMFWELLTGRKLFEGGSPLATIQSVLEEDPAPPSSVLRLVPADLDTICLKCLQKEPGRRYRSARELAEDLGRWLRGEPILARRVGFAERTWLWCRRKPALAAMAGTALLALLVTISVAGWRIRVAAQQEALQRYVAKIREANRAIEDGAVDHALEALMQCSDRLRHWEWGRLLYECLQEVATIPAHTNSPQFLLEAFVSSMDFDESGDKLATLGAQGDLSISNPVSGVVLWSVKEQGNPVVAYSFRPGKKQIMVSRLDGRLEVFDSENGHLIEELIAPHAGGPDPGADRVLQVGWGPYSEGSIRDPFTRRPWVIRSMAWDTSGEYLLTVQASGRVSVMGTPFKTPLWIRDPEVSSGPVAAWFAPVSGQVVIQSAIGVEQLDPRTWERISMMQWPESSVAPELTCASPEGDLAILIAPDWSARLKRKDGSEQDLGIVANQSKNAPFKPFFSPDGAMFCTLGGVGRAALYEVRNGLPTLRFPYPVYGGAFSTDHRQVAVFGPNRSVHVWDIRSGLEVRTLNGHLSTVSNVDYDPRGRLLASASREGVVKTWAAVPPDHVLFGETVTTGSEYSPDLQWLATGPSWRGVQLWDARTGELCWNRPSRTQLAYNLRFSPDSQHLYVAGSDRNVRIMSVKDGHLEGMLVGHQAPAVVVACSPDGQYVASGDYAGKLIIWHASTRTAKWVIDAHPPSGGGLSFVWDVEFDRNSRWVVTAGSGPPRVWSVASGKLVAKLNEHRAGTMWVTFDPHSDHVLGAGADHVVRKWELPSGKLVNGWSTTSQSSSKLSHTPDGERFAMAVADVLTWGFSIPSVEIWDAKEGHLLLSRAMHADAMYSVNFDSTGLRLTTASMDTTVRQWEAFPWRDSDYPGTSNESLLEKARRYAGDHWRQVVYEAGSRSAGYGFVDAPPLNPGIPDWERERWPKRTDGAGPGQIDLDRHYTGVLDSCFYPNWHEGEWGDELSSLPTGLQAFGGVTFDVRGVVWLRPSLVHPNDQVFGAACHDYPTRVNGIHVGRKFGNLRVLHAANTLRYVPQPDQEMMRSGTLTVASYVLHYADGEEQEHAVVYGRDLRHWWQGIGGDPEPEVSGAEKVWGGTNSIAAAYDATLRVFMSTYPNPRPDVAVVSIDFVSRETPFAPFLIAMSVEE